MFRVVMVAIVQVLVQFMIEFIDNGSGWEGGNSSCFCKLM